MMQAAERSGAMRSIENVCINSVTAEPVTGQSIDISVVGATLQRVDGKKETLRSAG